MRKISILLAAAALLTLPSCRFIRISDELKETIKDNASITYNGDNANGESITASNVIASRDFTTGDFHALTCNLPCDITYLPGDCAVSVSGPDNVLQHIDVQNANGTLTIKLDGTKIRNIKDIECSISSPVLENLSVNGAADFEAPRGITALDFKAVVNGAADMEIKGLKTGSAEITVNGAGDTEIDGIDCDALTVAINGAGDGTFSGRAGKADMTISGAGDIDASALDCKQFNSKVRGIGSVRKPK